MVGNERHPEVDLSIENLFPQDVLPTAHFLSKLPGFDQQYPKFIGSKEISAWSGKTVINGAETIIRIGHVHDETKILLDKTIGKEVWTIDESYYDAVVLSLNMVEVPITALLPDHLTTINGQEVNMRIVLWFKGGQHKDWKWDDNRVKPSDHPLITENLIDIERSNLFTKSREYSGGGFRSAEEAIQALLTLKKLIVHATPIEALEDPSPNPSSNALISRRYFPE